MRNFVEAGFDVALNDPLIGAGREVAHLGHRVMCPAVGAEPVAAREKLRLEDRLQHQLQGCLDHPIPNGRHGPGILPRRPVPRMTFWSSPIRSTRWPGSVWSCCWSGGGPPLSWSMSARAGPRVG